MIQFTEVFCFQAVTSIKFFNLGLDVRWLSVVVLLFFTACAPQKDEPVSQKEIRRVIAETPSITEILFDIGAGETLVGTSAFTKYPPEAADIEKIGGLYDVSYEKILSLEPDLVFCLEENREMRSKMRSFGIPFRAVNHRSIEGVLNSYEIIGDCFSQEIYERALVRKAELSEKLTKLWEQYGKLKPVRVLLCVDRSRGLNRLENVFIAANNPHYEEVIRLAGGLNAASGGQLPFISPSAEGIIDLAPEVIVELYIGNAPPENLQNDWKALGDVVPAVKNNRIYVITDDFATVPGPRIPLFVETLAKILHGDKE